MPLRPRLPLAVLALPAARLGALIGAGILAIALIAGGIRVLPLLLTPGVPLGVAPVLARGVLGVALETALFVAPPIAWALAAARLIERGEARALFAIGASPLGLVASTWPAALGFALAAGLAAASWGREAAAPGRLVADLLTEARAACEAAPAPAAADVPLLGIAWICLAGEPPRAVGATEGGAAFSARAIEPSADLRVLAARELTLVLPGGEGRVLVAEAEIRGIAPVGRASNLSPILRAALIAASAALLAALAGALALLGAIRDRARALALGAAGPAAALLVFSSLERAPAAPAIYLAAPLAGAAATALAGWALGARPARPGR